jgi:diguanylate cyclase (GGDEF)-like protein
LAVGWPAQAGPPSPAPAQLQAAAHDEGARFDSLLLLAEEAPARARAALDLASPADTLRPDRPRSRDEALLRAWVAVRTNLPAPGAPGAPGDDGLARRWATMWTELAEAGAAVSPRLADADRQLVQALLADRDGLAGVEALANQALAGYEAHCGTLSPLQADCELRGRWQARQVLAQQAHRRHASTEAHTHALAMLELAVAGRDRRRQAWSQSELALAASDLGDDALATTHLDRAWLLAGHGADLTLQQRLAVTEAVLASARGDTAQAQRAIQRQWALARRGHSPRQQAAALANLSDHAVKTGAPGQGLRAAEQGLALLGADGPAGLRSTLLNNAMLSRAALGRIADARRDFESLQTSLAAAGATGRQLTSLREFSDALATAGDLPGALEMHHREQALAEQLTTTNREAALAELRTRFDREAQQRRILLLERDNALSAAAVANQALNQRLWAAAGGVLALAGVLLLLLVRRVRDTRRRLQDHQASLRVQSERDALTGVASRRHAQALLRTAGQADGGFSGALLMIDIDHFKQVNDGSGHAVGDQVLAEVARRIAATVRPQDLVARWGGEEFLVHAPGLTPAECGDLARRVLLAVAGTPVAVAGAAPLRVTVSLGHGVFPLATHHLALSPEQALNLADMALYTAKRLGRHRATGILGCTAGDAQALQAVEADFERAWLDGRVSLHTEVGPGPALDGAGGADPAAQAVTDAAGVAETTATPGAATALPADPREAGAH